MERVAPFRDGDMYSVLGSQSEFDNLIGSLDFRGAFIKEFHFATPDHLLAEGGIACGEGDLVRVLIGLPFNVDCHNLELLLYEPVSGHFHFSFGDDVALSAFVQRRKIELTIGGSTLSGARLLYRLFDANYDRFELEYSKQNFSRKTVRFARRSILAGEWILELYLLLTTILPGQCHDNLLL